MNRTNMNPYQAGQSFASQGGEFAQAGALSGGAGSAPAGDAALRQALQHAGAENIARQLGPSLPIKQLNKIVNTLMNSGDPALQELAKALAKLGTTSNANTAPQVPQNAPSMAPAAPGTTAHPTQPDAKSPSRGGGGKKDGGGILDQILGAITSLPGVIADAINSVRGEILEEGQAVQDPQEEAPEEVQEEAPKKKEDGGFLGTVANIGKKVIGGIGKMFGL